MSKLFTLANAMTTTANGMDAYKDVGDALVGLFFKIGTSRGVDMTQDFLAAYDQNPEVALRILLWSRDIRGGAGERQRFRDLLLTACAKLGSDANALLERIPEVGRYDDLHALVGTEFEDMALNVHLDGIKSGNGLACKWAPRKGVVASKLRSMWGVSPKFYRKSIVSMTKVVEQLMCAGKWDEIVYSHVPSKAASLYASAFRSHDAARYQEYLGAVMSGEAKMHAGAIFPHDIYKALKNDPAQADAQWKSLPDYLEGTDERILVMSDVSGSMMGEPMNISIALGLYFSERLGGLFKDCVLTFTDVPSLVKLPENGTLQDRANALSRIKWGMSTNLEAAFDVVLNTAKRHKLSAGELPTKLLIISDMQFNHAVGYGTAFEMIEQKFNESGYQMPQVVFWNVNGRATDNAPVRFDQQGVALVSGASPSVVKAVMGGELDPVKVMMKAVMSDRYNLEI